MATALALKGLCKEYLLAKRQVKALANVDLTVAQGSFVTVVGRSGCGKTTLLRLIGGLESRSAGEIVFQPGSAKIGMVFQEPRLMPWLTVEQNVALAIEHKAGREEVRQTVAYYLDLLGLTSFRKAYPDQISGGMAQRVALGRALCFNADIILMDEPLSALDAFTRRNLQEELVKIFLACHKTILFVTHDVEEALLMGQRVIVMESGQIIRDMEVPFSYPRTAASEAFYRLREDILASIRGNT